MSDAANRSAWVCELSPAPSVEDAFRRLSRLPHCVLLDSALRDPQLGRHSFLAADPFDWLEAGPGVGDLLGAVQQKLAPLRTPTLPGLPPWQGGAAGLLSYDLGRSLEALPAPRHDEFGCPAMAIGFYDTVLAFDHAQQRAWVVSQGWPAATPEARRRRAIRRGNALCRQLAAPPGGSTPQGELRDPSLSLPACRPLSASELAPQYPVGDAESLTSNFSRQDYQELVARAVEYIRAGDIFQVNLSQRLLHPAIDTPVNLYLRMRRRNPGTFAGYFDIGPLQILSASPERLVSVRGRRVETRPIKGTRRLLNRPEADLFAAADLHSSAKDRAENIMIVDLLRNDLSRVCRDDSVKVTQLCHLEQYAYVQHLVSAVAGELRDDAGPIELLRAVFPGGSITGAPKVRAMEIIAELEPTARGAYCGALGYVGGDGAADWNILIRTVTAGRGWWQIPAGGGIVADSDPVLEYQETRDKARGIIESLC